MECDREGQGPGQVGEFSVVFELFLERCQIISADPAASKSS